MKRTVVAVLLALALSPTQAVEISLEQQVEARLINVFGPRVKVKEVAPLANKQILEVVLIDGSSMHMTPDLNFFLYRDELYQIKNNGVTNITETRNNPRRVSAMQSVKDEQAVVFKAKGKEKSVISVFTDIDCGYCQKLHQEVPRLNELGITVRYLAYPRAGIMNPQTGMLTDSYQKVNYVWCAANKTDAMTQMKMTQRDLGMAAQQAMRGGNADAEKEYFRLEKVMNGMLEKSKDCGAPIAAQFELGGQVGVTGTPAIILQDGSLVPGYMPADDLAKRIGVL